MNCKRLLHILSCGLLYPKLQDSASDNEKTSLIESQKTEYYESLGKAENTDEIKIQGGTESLRNDQRDFEKMLQENKLEIDQRILLKLSEADAIILIIGEEASGKTTLIKAILNAIENTTLETVKYILCPNVDYLPDCNQLLQSENVELNYNSKKTTFTKGLRFYYHEDYIVSNDTEFQKKKILIIDTPGILIDRDNTVDYETILLLKQSLDLSDKINILFTKKSDEKDFYPSVMKSLNELAPFINKKQCPVYIALTFYAGTKVFNEDFLPFDKYLIKKVFTFENSIFSVENNMKQIKNKSGKLDKGAYKAKKLLNTILTN